MSKKAKALRRFVASDGRIHPVGWHDFFLLLSRNHPNTPVPLILGAAGASDMAKRVRLLEQLVHVESDHRTVDLADVYLRGLTDHDWVKGQEPPSNMDEWGNEDVPPFFFTLAL